VTVSNKRLTLEDVKSGRKRKEIKLNWRPFKVKERIFKKEKKIFKRKEKLKK